MSLFERIAESLEAPHMNMQVTEASSIGSHIRKIRLEALDRRRRAYPVGSYIQPMIGGYVPRAYSVAEDLGTGCTIIVSTSGHGVGARFFEHARGGEIIKVYGPFDDFRFKGGTGKPKIFLATGTGVSPFVRMVKEALMEGVPVLLGVGVPTEKDIPYRSYFEELGRTYDTFDFMPSLSSPSPEWKGARGFVTDQFRGHEAYLRMSDIYVCGIPPMVIGTRGMLERAGVPEEQIFIQKFG